jgi:Leucine-rich repeat (LRR) protein
MKIEFLLLLLLLVLAKSSSARTANELDLSKRNLTRFDSSAYIVTARSITRLNLSFNRIESLREGGSVFSAFSSLESIDLSHNRLQTINSQAFFNNRALSALNLSRNRIREIESGAFAAFASLGLLDLSHNNLQLQNRSLCSSPDYSTALFSGCTILSLDLSHNNFSYFKSWLLEGISGLTKLNLSSNQLTSIDASHQLAKSLAELDLSRNQLHAVTLKASPSPLRKLSLAWNENLQGIKRERFSTKLEWLDLEGCSGGGHSTSWHTSICGQKSNFKNLTLRDTNGTLFVCASGKAEVKSCTAAPLRNKTSMTTTPTTSTRKRASPITTIATARKIITSTTTASAKTTTPATSTSNFPFLLICEYMDYHAR